MADIDFTPDEVFQATCAYLTMVFVKLNYDTLASTAEDATSEIALLNERIAYLQRKVDDIEKDMVLLETEVDTQQSFLASVANNALSRLGEEATVDDFDLAFNDGVVKGAVVGMSRIVSTKE